MLRSRARSAGRWHSFTAEPLEGRTLLATTQELVTANRSFSEGIDHWNRVGDFWAGTDLPNPHTAPGYASGGVTTGGVRKNDARGSIQQSVSIPADATSVTLSFWLNISTEETTTTLTRDWLYVRANGQDLRAFSNLSGPFYSTYKEVNVNLAGPEFDYRGRTIDLTFRAETNLTLPTVFRIDDVSVKAVGPDVPLTVSGSVAYRGIDQQIKPASHVAVFVWERQSSGSDYILATGETDASGRYSITTDGNGNRLLNVDDAAGETGTRDLYIMLVAANVAARAMYFPTGGGPAVVHRHTSSTISDVPGGVDDRQITITDTAVTPDNAEPWGAVGYAMQARQWLRNVTPSGWTRSQVTIFIPLGTWPGCGGDQIELPINWRTRFNDSVIAHEYGHAVQFAARGNSYPPNPQGPTPHVINSRSNEAFAWIEGWAEFFQNAVFNGNTNDDLERASYWLVPPPSGDDRYGNTVEGAIASTLWDLYDGLGDDGVSGRFTDIWDTFLTEDPNSFWNASGTSSFYHAWNRRYGRTTAVDEIFVDHGMPVFDDQFEDNDTFDSATPVGDIQPALSGLVLSDTADFFKFSLTHAGEGSEIRLSFDNRRGDLSCYLYDLNHTLVGRSESPNDLERINLSDVAPGQYYLKVFGDAGDFNPNYSLSLIDRDDVAPSAAVGPIAPNPRREPVDGVSVMFSEPVSGVQPTHFALTRDGGTNLLPPSATVSSADGGRTWTLVGLGGATATPGSYTLTLNSTPTITDSSGNGLAVGAVTSWVVVPSAQVVGRYVFYGNSPRVGDTEFGAPQAAENKHALLSNQTPSSANVTGFSRGLNGILIDMVGLPAGNELTVDDFDFAVKRGAADWSDVPDPHVRIERGGVINSADRIVLTWPDGMIRNAWLNVVVLANARTWLTSNDKFYFGNLVADTGGGDLAVDDDDVLSVRRHLHDKTPDSAAFDFDNDGIVSIRDYALVRMNHGRRLPQFTPRPPLPGTSFSDVAIPQPARRPMGRRGAWESLAVNSTW